jgi:hypothetical protein
MEKFGPMRERRKQLDNQSDYVEAVLTKGVEQARKTALPLL